MKDIIQPLTTKEYKKFTGPKRNRDRYKKFPERLPTKARMPLPPDEHKHIGLYENKQNLYLITAHVYNRLMGRTDFLLQRVEELEKRIADLEPTK